jgi:hypothetical protein
MEVRDCLEEVDGRGGLPAKGFGGRGRESRLGDSAAASFGCSDMSLAPSFVSKSLLSSILAAETEAISQPKKNVRTSIVGLPKLEAKARMPSKRLGIIGIALQ